MCPVVGVETPLPSCRGAARVAASTSRTGCDSPQEERKARARSSEDGGVARAGEDIVQLTALLPARNRSIPKPRTERQTHTRQSPQCPIPKTGHSKPATSARSSCQRVFTLQSCLQPADPDAPSGSLDKNSVVVEPWPTKTSVCTLHTLTMLEGPSSRLFDKTSPHTPHDHVARKKTGSSSHTTKVSFSLACSSKPRRCRCVRLCAGLRGG